MESQKRVRFNAKQTAKNYWYFDVTVEVTANNDVSSDNINVLKIIQEKEKEFRADGRRLVGDGE